ncbi:MAG: transcription termination/antitermination protein NusA [Gemmataceae bacterium]|nr:transcription termination/antitermination protein NusA [Gemmataceae bacterium]
MNGQDLIRGVDILHREKTIPRELIFSSIEKALRLAIVKWQSGLLTTVKLKKPKKKPESIIEPPPETTAALAIEIDPDEVREEDVQVAIDRQTGEIVAKYKENSLSPDAVGRIAAQSAKQLMIQNFREAESEQVFNEYNAQKGDQVQGTVQRIEKGAATVSLGKVETILPRSEQIPGETHHIGERVKAVILEVRKVGHRVRIVLSRTHPDFVRRLFENEIPEIADRTIEIKAVSREAGYRSKVAVSSIDMKVDCVGACVGVRGSRIKNIVDELSGERIDIVRWNDSLQVLIPYALQPAQIEEVFLYPKLGRAIVLVKEDQLSLAIGRRGQNVRLASKLVGWDIDIMTHDELNDVIQKAEGWFSQLPGLAPEMVEGFIEEGFLSFEDITYLEPAQLVEMTGVTEDQAEDIIAYAEEAAEQVEEEKMRAKELAEESGVPIPVPVRGAAVARQAFENLFVQPAAESQEPAQPGEETDQAQAVLEETPDNETSAAVDQEPAGDPPQDSTPEGN